MTIGVIITVYNLEAYVAQAILSALKQSRKAEQIIVVNDASEDRSLDIIKKFTNGITVISHDINQGVLPSVIEAIKLINTDVIALLDGDDFWDQEKLKEIEKLFELDSNIMMVLHNYHRVNAQGENLPGTDTTQINLDRIVHTWQLGRQSLDHLLKESILSYLGVWLGSALSFRKSALNLPKFEAWSKSLWGHELSHQDQPLAAYLIATNPAGKIEYINRALFNYRIFGENSSGSSNTLPKAMRTLQRSRATLLRTYNLVKQMQGQEKSSHRQKLKLKEVAYLEALYEGRTFLALQHFKGLFFSLWSTRDRGKEIIRILGIVIIGPSRFLSLK